MGDRNQMSVMPSVAAGTPTGSAQRSGLAFSHADEIAQPGLLQGRARRRPHRRDGARPTTAASYRFTFPASAANGQPRRRHHRRQRHLHRRCGHGHDDRLGRQRQRPVRRPQPDVRLRHVRPARRRRRHCAGRHAGTRYATFDTSRDAAGDAAARDVVHLARPGQQEPRPGGHRHRASTRSTPPPRRRGTTGSAGRGAGRDRDAAGHALLQPVPAEPLPELAVGEHRHRRRAALAVREPGVGADRHVDRHARPAPKVVDGQIYVNNGFWDTYRTVWPAYSLLYPDIAAKIADGFVQQYRDGGWVARWSSPGYADLMTGTSSDVAFAEAYLNGRQAARPARRVRRGASRTRRSLRASSAVGRKGIETSLFLGYTPTSTGESVSWALEGFINDFGIGNMARGAGQGPGHAGGASASGSRRSRSTSSSGPATTSTSSTRRRSSSRDATPTARSSTGDPLDWGGVYTETNGWNFAFTRAAGRPGTGQPVRRAEGAAREARPVLRDPGERRQARRLRRRRSTRCSRRATVRMGQLGMSNQAVAPHPVHVRLRRRAVRRRRRRCARSCSGSTSAARSARATRATRTTARCRRGTSSARSGIYPLQAGSANWAIGSPQFTQMTRPAHERRHRRQRAGQQHEERLRAGREGQRHEAARASRSTGRARQGRPRSTSRWAPKPSDFGARAKNDAPPSLTKGDEAPKPLKDTTGPGRGTATATDLATGDDAKALFDDTSRTQVAFTSATP